MKPPRGYRLVLGDLTPDGRAIKATVYVAWWRVLLIRLLGKRGA